MEFRPGPELRQKIDSFRRELSVRVGRPVRTTEVLVAILEQFFEKKDSSSA